MQDPHVSFFNGHGDGFWIRHRVQSGESSKVVTAWGVPVECSRPPHFTGKLDRTTSKADVALDAVSTQNESGLMCMLVLLKWALSIKLRSTSDGTLTSLSITTQRTSELLTPSL